MQGVSAPNLYKPELLHTVYLRLFKHMMDWVPAFLKKHPWLQVFDDTCKGLPRYAEFLVPKKAYHLVPQWQEKHIRNLDRDLWAVLVVALGQPEDTQT